MPNIILRAPELEDIHLLYKWENDENVWADSCTIAPYSLNQLTEYIANYDGDIYKARQLRLMIEDKDSGETVGCIDLYDYDPINNHCFIGFIISPTHRLKGYAHIAVGKAANYCKSRLSMVQLVAITSVNNIGCKKVLINNGFTCSGLLRKWIKTKRQEYIDAEILQLDLDRDTQ